MALLDDLCGRMAESSARNYSDESSRSNAENASEAGLEVRVTRTYDGVGLHDGKERCEWCLERCDNNMTLQEAYEKGAFQRHEGCECDIEITTNKSSGKVKGTGYKGWNFAKELEKRKSIGLDEEFFADELVSRVKRYMAADMEDLYEDAKNGKRHGGIYIQAINKSRPELESSIKNHIREVEEHIWKILHPETGMEREDPNDPIERARAINTWKNHRLRNAQEAAVEIEVWRRMYGK